MIDPKTLTREQLLDPKFADTFFAEAQELVDFPDHHTKDLAERLAVLLDLDRDGELTELEKRYSSLVSWMRFAALSFYEIRDIAGFVERRLFDALGQEAVDVQRSIKARLIELLPLDRDGFRQMLREAMAKNEQLVSSQLYQSANGQVRNTVANWLRDYASSTASGEDLNMRRTQFFVSSRNFQVLPEPTKRKIRALFDIYEWLKLSSLSPEGFDETLTVVDKEGSYYDLDRGRLVKRNAGTPKSATKRIQSSPVAVRPSASPIDPLVSLRQKYTAYRRDRQRILDKEDEVLVKTKGESDPLYHELSGAVQSGDKFWAVACLKVLARQKMLAQALSGNPSWWESTAEYIAKKYTGKYPAPEVALAVSSLKFNPVTPAAISEFLQFVLKVRLKLGDAESALIGVEIGQLLGGEYQGMAYGNAETGEFEWVKNKIADRKLVGEMG